MALVQERIHPRGLNFENQRKVVHLRDDKGLSWENIAKQVRNRQGLRPSWKLCANTYAAFSTPRSRRPYRYANCGRRPWKVTKAVASFLVRRLLVLRRAGICTARTLARAAVTELGVTLDDSTVRKVLAARGYHWLRRTQKPQYSKEARQRRLAFAQRAVAMSDAELRQSTSLSLDGVVLTYPPEDDVARFNHCRYADTHVYRRRSEKESPELAGGDAYGKQVPLERALPLWGGIGRSGFAVVTMHEQKKITTEEWVAAVRAGHLQAALRRANAGRTNGPWTILCDGEKFLHSKLARHAHTARAVSLWQVPAKSPDLNPVEKYWSWLRRRLRALDFADLRAKRAAMTKPKFRQRVKRLITTRASDRVAARCLASFRKTCLEVVKKKGAAARG